MERYDRTKEATEDNVIWHMRFAFWITKATDTHSEYVIIQGFPRQQRLLKRSSALRYTSIASLD